MKRLLAAVGTALLMLEPTVQVGRAQTSGATASATLRGTVYDSVRHAPVAGATVVAIQAEPNGSPSISQVHSDTRGAFEIRALAPGHYTISVESAALDSAGLSIPDIERTLEAGSVTQLSLATLSRDTRVRLACGGPVSDTTLGAIIGVVRDVATGRVLPRALLVLQWSDFSVDTTAHYHARARIASVTTDSIGAYRACGVPAQRSVFLQAQLGARSTGIVEDRINESGVLEREFALPGDSTTRGFGILDATVLDAKGHPIKDARVALVGTTRTFAVSDDGHVHVDSLPLGTQQLEVVAIGFYPERETVDVAVGVHRSLSVTMEPMGVVLDAMRTVASANNPKYREFDQRRKQGWGDFYTEADIAKRQIFDLSDFFMVLRHINAHVDPGGHVYFTTTNRYGITTILAGTSDPLASAPVVPLPHTDPADAALFHPPALGSSGVGAGCQPAIIIDGNPSYSADDLETIPPSVVHGIEVYGAHDPVPVQYRYGTGGGCGAIIIWTK